MENFPKVSVVVPLYNKAPFIKETLESVINQSFRDFELIVIDDGSTDGSQEIVKSIKDHRLTFYQNPVNMGTARIGNRLIELSKGKYIARVDADDILPQDRLEKQVCFMDANPAIGVCSGQMKSFGKNNVLWKIAESDKELKAGILFRTPIFQPAAMIRSSVLKESGIGYDPSSGNIGEDWLFWFRLSFVTNFANLPDILNYYRTGEQNISSQSVKAKEGRLYLFGQIFKKLKLPEEKVKIHFYTKPEFIIPPSNESVIEFKNWLKFLDLWNKQNEYFDQYLFSLELNKSWNRFFYFLVDHNKALWWRYMMSSGGLKLPQLKYLVSGWIKGS